MGRTLPDRATFRKIAAATGPRNSGTLVTVCRRLLADQLTPVLAYRRLVEPDDRMAPSFLLESVIDGDRIGRYSFLGSRPMLEVIARGHDVELRHHLDPSRSRRFTSPDPLSELQKLTAGWKLAPSPLALPGFVGGWFGCAGYDTVRYLEGEKLPAPPPDDRGLPDLHMGLYRQIIAFDHVQKTILVMSQVLLGEHADSAPGYDAAYDAGCREVDAIVERIERQRVTTPPGSPELAVGDIDLETPPPSLPLGNMADGQYQRAVEKCKRYIADGDIFQVVISQRFERRTHADPFDIYRALRVVNPSPYMFYLHIDGAVLVGSSPEILCHVSDGQVINRPLAGTRRRGSTDAEDRALERDLLADPKERAEHIMLVDLGRNDIGRVCEPGSIELPKVLAVERYSHVMHISSTVIGRLRPGATCWDALRYTLPVGTVSGAPKVRAMQIIDELEPTRRGPYAGAVGHADFAGNMDMAIALRTMVILPDDAPPRTVSDTVSQTTVSQTTVSDTVSRAKAPAQWRVHVQAGAGIVADSVPDNEHQETVNKAAALAKAVDVAERAFGGSSQREYSKR